MSLESALVGSEDYEFENEKWEEKSEFTGPLLLDPIFLQFEASGSMPHWGAASIAHSSCSQLSCTVDNVSPRKKHAWNKKNIHNAELIVILFF